MSELMHQMDALTSKLTKEQAERDRERAVWASVAEFGVAMVAALVLSLICC